MNNMSIEELANFYRQKLSKLEVMACLMSRQLRDGEMVGTGAGSAVARAACRLAQLKHAPNLSYVAGGSGAVNSLQEPLVNSSCDYTNLICEAVISTAELIASVGTGKLTTFLYGGLQVDKYGNVNLSVIGDYNKPKLRGPGSAALPFLPNAERAIIFMTDHTPRSFVEKVDFRTAPGFLEGGESWRQAKANGQIRGNGPFLVISPLAVLDFEEESKAMRLVSVHSDTTFEEVIAATGFELIIPAEVPTTVAPSTLELTLLRQFDTSGLLRE